MININEFFRILISQLKTADVTVSILIDKKTAQVINQGKDVR
jgi:hypothetical protein